VNFAMQSPTLDEMSVSGGDLTPAIGEDRPGGGTDLDAEETYQLDFTGDPHPKQGYHVKLTVNAPDSLGADVKHKVFWVQPCEATTPPVEESTPPVEESTPPVEESTPPVEEESTPPVEESTPPVEESTPPVEEESTPPVEESTPPVEESTPPVEEESTPPVEESTPPVEESTPPVEESTAPAEEQASPGGRTPGFPPSERPEALPALPGQPRLGVPEAGAQPGVRAPKAAGAPQGAGGAAEQAPAAEGGQRVSSGAPPAAVPTAVDAGLTGEKPAPTHTAAVSVLAALGGLLMAAAAVLGYRRRGDHQG
jgi:hypothetical protein